MVFKDQFHHKISIFILLFIVMFLFTINCNNQETLANKAKK